MHVAVVGAAIASVRTQVAFVLVVVALVLGCGRLIAVGDILSQFSTIFGQVPAVVIDVALIGIAVNPVFRQIAAVLVNVASVFADVFAVLRNIILGECS
jgi:hypothetical protein